MITIKTILYRVSCSCGYWHDLTIEIESPLQPLGQCPYCLAALDGTELAIYLQQVNQERSNKFLSDACRLRDVAQ